MDVKIYPKKLNGTVDIKSSKSDAHRLLICGALADAPVNIGIRGVSEDILATIRCMENLGAEITEKGPGRFYVVPVKAKSDLRVLDCGESGSTLRFLLPVGAGLGGPIRFEGHGRLPERPMKPLLDAVAGHGCSFEQVSQQKDQHLPLLLHGKMTAGTFTLPGNISSQFITGLLLAFPLTGGESQILLTSETQSKGYIDMTISAMGKFGIDVEECKDGFGGYRVSKTVGYRSPGTLDAEGDWSNGAFWLVAGALGGPVSLKGLSASSLQGDKAVADLLFKAGAEYFAQTGGTLGFKTPKERLRPMEIDASEIPDLVPVLAVAASAADGVTRIYNAERLRIKESDRLKTTAQLINGLGGQAEETEDGLIITGKDRLKGGTVHSAGDHRIAMSAAVASVFCDGPVTILEAQAVGKSYPDFFEDFRQLGGDFDVI